MEKFTPEEYGRRDLELPCMCGHKKSDHDFGPFYNWNGSKDKCWNCSISTGKAFHKFKLDNLSYIEQIANARGLV